MTQQFALFFLRKKDKLLGRELYDRVTNFPYSSYVKGYVPRPNNIPVATKISSLT